MAPDPDPPLTAEEQNALNKYVAAIAKSMEIAYSNLKTRIPQAEKELKKRIEADKSLKFPRDLLKMLKPMLKIAKKSKDVTNEIVKGHIKLTMGKLSYRKLKMAIDKASLSQEKFLASAEAYADKMAYVAGMSWGMPASSIKSSCEVYVEHAKRNTRLYRALKG